jgi:alpha-maltose-1-phosphate synthase
MPGRPVFPEPLRIRVLLLALQCNPDWVSVPLVGWSHSQALAKVTDAHLVTHVHNRENLIKAGLVEGKDFTVLDPRTADAIVHRLSVLLGVPFGSQKGWTTLTALSVLSYGTFERLVWRTFGARIRAGEFDVVHRLTPLSPAIPSPLAARCARARVPFVLGPLNGGLPWPAGFGHVRSKEREWLSYVRGAHRWLPGYRSTRAAAAALIAGSRRAVAEIPNAYGAKAVYIPENAVDPDRFDRRAGVDTLSPLRVAFVGRLVPTKGVDMLLEAAAPLARAGRLAIDVIGDGPEAAPLRALAEREQMTDAVTFPGWVDHREIQARMARSHVFALPSVREFGGGVVLEAMALGLVPIVLDYGGPGELVSPATGFALPMGSREHVVQQLRSTLERLVADPSVVPPMGERARERVLRSFTWAVKAGQVVEVYRWVLGQREKPDFGMPLPDSA